MLKLTEFDVSLLLSLQCVLVFLVDLVDLVFSDIDDSLNFSWDISGVIL